MKNIIMRVPLLNFEGVSGSQDLEVPGPRVMVPLLHHAHIWQLYTRIKCWKETAERKI